MSDATTPRADAVVMLGSRRAAISLAPLIRVMTASERWNVTVLTTGGPPRHLARTMESLDVVAAEDLGVEISGLSQDELIRRAIERSHEVIDRRAPSTLVLEGASTMSLGAALAAFYLGVMVAHVTSTQVASPRRTSTASVNARLIAQLARLHFVPNVAVSTSLLHQGANPHDVVIVGAPAVDNLRWVLRNKPGHSQFTTTNRRVLVVLRQSESITAPLDIVTQVCVLLSRDVDVEIVLPLQHRLVVRSVIEGRLASRPRVRLTGDLDYRDYVATLESADVVVSDSLAVQAEAQALHKPCVVVPDDFLDDEPDAQSQGGVRAEAAYRECRRLLDDDEHRDAAVRASGTSLGGIASNSMELRLRTEVMARHDAAREAARPTSSQEQGVVGGVT